MLLYKQIGSGPGGQQVILQSVNTNNQQTATNNTQQQQPVQQQNVNMQLPGSNISLNALQNAGVIMVINA